MRTHPLALCCEEGYDMMMEEGESPYHSYGRRSTTFTWQQEALQSLQGEYDKLWEHYEQLHCKSGEIIATLQKERDEKIAECESLRSQIQTLKPSREQYRHENVIKISEERQSELESVQREYNILLCNYTSLKLEYESALTSHGCEIQDLEKEHSIEVSLLLEKLKIAQEDNDTVSNVQQLRELQRLNSELEQKSCILRQEMEANHMESKISLSKKDKVILEQSECLKRAENEIESLKAKCTTLSESLETTQNELSQCLEKQLDLHSAVENAQRATSRTKMELEELKASHKSEIAHMEIQLTQKLRENSDHIQKEKSVLEGHVEILSGTIKEYEDLLRSKEQELKDQVKSLTTAEWEKRVPLEKQVTLLQDKLTNQDRLHRLAEEERDVQERNLQSQVEELSSKCLSLEDVVRTLNTGQDQQFKIKKEMEKELQTLKVYKRKYQSLQCQNTSLLEAKQQLESECTRLKSTVYELETAISEAQKDITELKTVHRQTLDNERVRWQDENKLLLERLNEEEEHVKRLLTGIEDEKMQSKKVKSYYKKKTLNLKDAVKLAKAKQIEVEAEKESIRKSLNLDQIRLKNTISKLKQKEREFNILLQGDYCYTSSDIMEHRMSPKDRSSHIESTA